MSFFEGLNAAGGLAQGLGGLGVGFASLFQGNSQTPGEWNQRFASMPAAFWRSSSPQQRQMQQQVMNDTQTRYNMMTGPNNPFALFRNSLGQQSQSPAASTADMAQRYAAMYAAKAGVNPNQTQSIPGGSLGNLAQTAGTTLTPPPQGPAELPVTISKLAAAMNAANPTPQGMGSGGQKYYENLLTRGV
jgi:hypothetical protein